MASTEVLVRAAQAGDRFAFAELVRLYERATIITASDRKWSNSVERRPIGKRRNGIRRRL